MSDVSVVIGNHQGERVLGDCLDSLAGQTEPPREVIVVDGGSTDGSRRIAEEHGARWIAESNRGLGFLYNRGAELASSEFVLLANNDIALDTRCVELLRQPLADDTTLFASDARQLDWSGESLVHAHTTLRRGRLLREALPGFELDLKAPASAIVPTVTANGGCMLVRRTMMLALGGFDETFFMDFEDIDLCWRAWLRGWGSVYVPDAWLRHRVGAVTTSKVLPRRLASSHHNLTRFSLKCLPAADAAKVVLAELLRIPRHPVVVPRGLAQLAGEMREIVRLRRQLRPRRALLDWMVAGQPPDGSR
jgi:N-acetylglucosaminyl-diphospho-decaprenol L-rhamnosyltransferase